MADAGNRGPSYEEVVADNERLRVENEALVAVVAELEARIAELERRLGQNSGNSGLPPSRDPAAERQRQAEARAAKKKRQAGGKAPRPGKQRGSKGQTLQMTDVPDEVIDHEPQLCGGCGADLADAQRVRRAAPPGDRPASSGSSRDRAPSTHQTLLVRS